ARDDLRRFAGRRRRCRFLATSEQSKTEERDDYKFPHPTILRRSRNRPRTKGVLAITFALLFDVARLHAVHREQQRILWIGAHPDDEAYVSPLHVENVWSAEAGAAHEGGEAK